MNVLDRDLYVVEDLDELLVPVSLLSFRVLLFGLVFDLLLHELDEVFQHLSLVVETPAVTHLPLLTWKRLNNKNEGIKCDLNWLTAKVSIWHLHLEHSNLAKLDGEGQPQHHEEVLLQH